MLPFTKRPGRGGEDGDVFTKDDLEDLAATAQKPASIAPPPTSARSVPPPPMSERPHKPAPDFSDDEVTNFIPSKSIAHVVHAARAQTVPPPPASRRPPASMPPPPVSSQRPGKFITGSDEDEDGRTVVRGAPKIVKRSVPPPPNSAGATGPHQPQGMGMPTGPTTISPAAVIKATLESARAAKRATDGALMPPPPAELLEDLADRHPGPPSVRPPPSQRPHTMQSPYTAPMGMQPVGVTELGATMLAGVQPISQIPQAPSSRGPVTGPPPPMHLQHHSYPPPGSIPPAPQSYGAAAPSGSVPGVANSMPAHFHVPHAPYSDGRMDPPGTSVTARHKVSGRPASAWAIALVAAGLFVGVGAVAVMQSNDSLMDTTASFVDPSRAAKGAPASAAQPGADPSQGAPTTAGAPTVVVPPAAADQGQGNGAAPAQPPVANNAPAPGGGVIGTGGNAAPPATQPETKPAPVAANTPAPPTPKAAWVAPRPQAPAAAPPAAAPPPATKPAATTKVASNDDPPAERPTKPTKPTKPGKGGANDGTDEETKKALEALQKAQLESSFGDNK